MWIMSNSVSIQALFADACLYDSWQPTDAAHLSVKVDGNTTLNQLKRELHAALDTREILGRDHLVEKVANDEAYLKAAHSAIDKIQAEVGESAPIFPTFEVSTEDLDYYLCCYAYIILKEG